MLYRFLKVFLLCLTFLSIAAQEVTVSEQIGLRNEYFYDVLGKIDGNILLFRDLGFDKLVTVFDEDLSIVKERNLEFEKKKIDVITIAPTDTSFNLFYSFKTGSKQFLKVNSYDSEGVETVSDTIGVRSGMKLGVSYKYSFSEDLKKVLLFTISDSNEMELLVFDLEKFAVLWEKTIEIEEGFLRREFKGIQISNKGEVTMVVERNNFQLKKKKHRFEIYNVVVGQEPTRQIIYFADLLSVNFQIKFNNKNDQLVIAGFYAESFEDRAIGYFVVNGSPKLGDLRILFHEFDDSLYEEVNNKNLRKLDGLNDFSAEQILLREDGGLILVGEFKKEFTKRSSFADNRRSSSSYTDYYNEDIVIFSINPNGEKLWRTFLPKKQFSQDDQGAFSSYFLFITPSLLHIVYNDEIKNDNTVSEYTIDPRGGFERKSLLSTEYQKLRLRFKDGRQITSTDFIVPSERNAKLALVRISY